MPAPENTLKSKMLRGEVTHGLWLNMCSPIVAEIAGFAGADWCLIDGEHAANDIGAIAAQVQALSACPTQTAVRVAKAEDWMIKHVLDLGVQTVIVPMVNTVAEAKAMATAMRYPPKGARGLAAPIIRASQFGAIADYATTANDQMCLMLQAETPQAMDNIEAICAIDGVDGVFIGPADLGASMGYIDDLGAQVVTDAICDGIKRIVAAGKLAGVLCFDPDQAAKYADLGARMIAIGSDLATLSSGLRQVVAKQ